MSMTELTESKLSRPLDKQNLANDTASLNALCGFLNNPAITGADAPKENRGASVVTPKPLAPELATVDAPEAVPVAPPRRDLSKVFYTGRLCVGKDYVAGLTGARIFGFADPIYALANYFFGTNVTSASGKDENGMRSFLQTVGQWGWGCTEKEYPFTPARAMFIETIRRLGGSIDNGSNFVDWSSFGRNPSIWIEATLRRIELFHKDAPGAAVATTNVRFEREYRALAAAGWTHFHVLCSAATWSERIGKRGLKPTSPELQNLSEKFAAHFDQDVTIKISRQRTGKKLNVIWNDNTPPPSPRLWTVPEYLKAFGPDVMAGVVTGE